MPTTKPPVGLRPRFNYIEPRLLEIQRAMNRFMAARFPIPEEWTREYNTLIEITNSKKHE
jgi:hypothetical protein